LKNNQMELRKEVEVLKTKGTRHEIEISVLKKEVLELKTGINVEVGSIKSGIVDINKALRTELDMVNKGIEEFNANYMI